MKIRKETTPQSLNSGQRIEGNKINKLARNNKGLYCSYLADTSDINLYWLANKLRNDCYSMQHLSKELIRSFIIDIEYLRSALA